MTLDPRAVAMQGVGFGPSATAFQGFADLQQVEQPGSPFASMGPPARRSPARRRNDDDDVLLLTVLS